MRNSKATFFLIVLSLAPPALAQTGISSSTWNGMNIELIARMDPGSTQVPGAVLTGTDRFYRLVEDRAKMRYFGYDLVVEPRGSQTFQIRIEPFSLSSERLAATVPPSWTVVPLLKYPLVPDVRVGDTVLIDLLENPATGQKVVDRLTLKRAKPIAEGAGSLRNFSLSELELTLENPRLFVDGKLVDASTRFGGSLSGSVLWFYLQGPGRFIVSLLPHPELGFYRAGEISENALSFADSGNQYRLQGSARIVPGTGRFHLYMRRDPKWRPSGSEANAPMAMGAADRPEDLGR
jgi:hypothetical protein